MVLLYSFNAVLFYLFNNLFPLFTTKSTHTLGLTFLWLSFCVAFFWVFCCVFVFLIFVGGLFISFLFPPPFSPLSFYFVWILAPFLLLLLCFLSFSPQRLPLILVAYVLVNIPPSAPTRPPSLVLALTLCCSQWPPVSQAAQGAPLPPPQRLHDLQTQNAVSPEPEARGKCVYVQPALCMCRWVCVCVLCMCVPVPELCTCCTVWAKRQKSECL